MVYHRSEKVQVPFNGQRVTSAYHVSIRLVDTLTGEVYYDNFRNIVVADGSAVADNFINSILQCYVRGLCLGKPLRLELDSERICDIVPDIFSHSYVSK